MVLTSDLHRHPSLFSDPPAVMLEVTKGNVENITHFHSYLILDTLFGNRH